MTSLVWRRWMSSFVRFASMQILISARAYLAPMHARLVLYWDGASTNQQQRLDITQERKKERKSENDGDNQKKTSQLDTSACPFSTLSSHHEALACKRGSRDSR
ncbi:hypothetical protein F5Y09DRAFT_299394 [Xylaria sp. FL1042]|nr:hypothetical protein F5Y09DRAFT_299394 [Xylaria sp. FL1042]